MPFIKSTAPRQHDNDNALFSSRSDCSLLASEEGNKSGDIPYNRIDQWSRQNMENFEHNTSPIDNINRVGDSELIAYL